MSKERDLKKEKRPKDPKRLSIQERVLRQTRDEWERAAIRELIRK